VELLQALVVLLTFFPRQLSCSISFFHRRIKGGLMGLLQSSLVWQLVLFAAWRLQSNCFLALSLEQPFAF